MSEFNKCLNKMSNTFGPLRSVEEMQREQIVKLQHENAKLHAEFPGAVSKERRELFKQVALAFLTENVGKTIEYHSSWLELVGEKTEAILKGATEFEKEQL